jgi:KDO2-lipid IV(A) lauroyltransferase
MRRAYDVESLPQRIAPRRLLERLRAGETLGVLCDLEVRRLAGAWLPFFGVPALTMTAPAALARAARLPLFPVRCVVRGARYRLIADEPLALDPALPRRDATLDLMTRLNAVFERWIRADPEQWAWHQPRWRTPAGERRAPPLHARAPVADTGAAT